MKHLIVCTLTLLSNLALQAHADQVGRDQWVDSMSSVLPTVFCTADQYFRQCFDVSQQVCEETAASATRVCLKKYADQFPEVFNQPDDGSHWGSVLGACVGEAYEITLMSKRINNKACNNPENWM